ncbi:MAG TPA: hypothetical protein VIL48_17970 [Acidimicrobiales bacterium]
MNQDTIDGARRHADRRDAGRQPRDRRCDDRGEGVISTAIAVLVLAAIGALMWVGFRAIWEDTEANTRDRVSEIGR